MKNSTYNFKLYFGSIELKNGRDDINRIVMDHEPGERVTFKKICGPKHRRMPNQTIYMAYAKVHEMTICDICGLFASETFYVKRAHKSRFFETDDTTPSINIVTKKVKNVSPCACRNPFCVKYQMEYLYKAESFRYGQCIVDGCTRTARKDEKCPIHGGNSINTIDEPIQFRDWAAGSRQSEYPNLPWKSFKFNQSYTGHLPWLFRDVEFPFPEYIDEVITPWTPSFEWMMTDEEMRYWDSVDGGNDEDEI